MFLFLSLWRHKNTSILTNTTRKVVSCKTLTQTHDSWNFTSAYQAVHRPSQSCDSTSIKNPTKGGAWARPPSPALLATRSNRARHPRSSSLLLPSTEPGAGLSLHYWCHMLTSHCASQHSLQQRGSCVLLVHVFYQCHWTSHCQRTQWGRCCVRCKLGGECMGPVILVVSCCFPKVEYVDVSGVEAVDFQEVEAIDLPGVKAMEIL